MRAVQVLVIEKLFWLAQHQQVQRTPLAGFSVLIFHRHRGGHRTAADARHGFGLGHFQLGGDRITDEKRFDEFPLVDLAEGKHGSFQQPVRMIKPVAMDRPNSPCAMR